MWKKNVWEKKKIVFNFSKEKWSGVIFNLAGNKGQTHSHSSRWSVYEQVSRTTKFSRTSTSKKTLLDSLKILVKKNGNSWHREGISLKKTFIMLNLGVVFLWSLDPSIWKNSQTFFLQIKKFPTFFSTQKVHNLLESSQKIPNFFIF